MSVFSMVKLIDIVVCMEEVKGKAFQKHGIGRELIARARSVIGEEVALILLSVPEAMGYYPTVGFEKIENVFIIKHAR